VPGAAGLQLEYGQPMRLMMRIIAITIV